MMKLRVLLALTLAAQPAAAGGLFLPGSGAISSSRAGAAVASADDGEALSVNPAGLAKTNGWTITISAALIQYSMEFDRRGSYDNTVAEDRLGFEGQDFGVVKNQPKPPLGIGTFQPIPVIAVVSDLGGRVEGLRVALGLYAPSGYPFRDMSNGYKFNEDFTTPPPPTRYDVMTSESALILPTLAAAYRISPKLDIGARFSAGTAKAKTSVAIWGTPLNVDESVRQDTLFTADVKDGFVPSVGIGATFRPTPAIEVGAVYNSSMTLRTKGTAQSIKGVGVNPDTVVGPMPDELSRCETGGTFETQKACITTQLPQNATIGARYKFLDGAERVLGDVELNVNWENWGKTCDFTSAGQARDPDCASPSQILVNLDTAIYNQTMTGDPNPVRVNFVNLGLQDTFSIRLGGSYHIPQGDNRITVRGGVAYDTAAARDGWLRASFDGAARVSTALGGAYRTKKWEVNVGGGFVYEGTNTNGGAANGMDCNPVAFEGGGSFGCQGNDQDRPLSQRQGPDPTNPLLDPELQTENPYNQGTIKSHYVLFMLGFSTWF